MAGGLRLITGILLRWPPANVAYRPVGDEDLAGGELITVPVRHQVEVVVGIPRMLRAKHLVALFHRQIRRAHEHAVRKLRAGGITAIEDYLRHYNEAPRRFIWTKDADMILDKIARCPKPLNA